LQTCRKTVIFFSLLLLLFKSAISKEVSPPESTINQSDTCKQADRLAEQAHRLFYRGQYLLSSTHYSLLSTTPCPRYPRDKALFNYALSMLELEEMSEVNHTLQDLVETGSPRDKRNSLLLKSFIYSEADPQLDQADHFKLDLWRLRQTTPYPSLSAFSNLKKENQKDLSYLQSELLSAPQKKPWLAATASAILPGAGQTYVGNFQSAAVAFLLNSLFLATTIELAKKDLPVSAVASGLVFSVTYFGNILNAADAAKKYNESSRRAPEQNLRKSLFPEFYP
jgi:hypothetical protein